MGEVPKGIRWSAEAGGPPKVRIGGVSGRGRGLTQKVAEEVPNAWNRSKDPDGHSVSCSE